MDHLHQLWLARIQELNANLRAVLELYMNWYTFFWTLNLAALAWIYGKTRADADHDWKVRVVIAWLFFAMCMCGALSSFACIGMLHIALARIESATLEAVGAGGSGTTSALTSDSFPRWFGYYGLFINGAALVAVGLIWGWLARREGRPTRAVQVPTTTQST